jgi:hypothetical protein
VALPPTPRAAPKPEPEKQPEDAGAPA